MREHPILFSGEMVLAILNGRKTQTRRVVKPPRGFWIEYAGIDFGCPYGQRGDRLWVRENIHRGKEGNLAFYAADKGLVTKNGECVPWVFNEPHVPSIHMPRWASRITLERTTKARVERLEDISEADAKAEGFNNRDEFLEYFYKLFPKLRGKNTWVWVIEFKRVEEAKG